MKIKKSVTTQFEKIFNMPQVTEIDSMLLEIIRKTFSIHRWDISTITTSFEEKKWQKKTTFAPQKRRGFGSIISWQIYVCSGNKGGACAPADGLCVQT